MRAKSPLEDASGLAAVGSWTARDPEGKPIRLAMSTDGHFVPVADLKAATPSSFTGKALDEKTKLPIAFVVKRGVHRWAVRDGEPEKQSPLDYHARVELSGRLTTLAGTELWQTTAGDWVRLKDIAVMRKTAAARLAEDTVLEPSRRPPEILLLGARLSQDVKCFSVGQRVMSVPTSEISLRAL